MKLMMKPNQKFTHYCDSGHGWVAVKKELLKHLGIADKISSCSYMRGKTAYLEEDDDATTFIEEVKRRDININIVSKHCKKDRSPIRSYETYKGGD